MATRPTSPRQTNAPHVQPATSVVTPQQTSVGVVGVMVTALLYGKTWFHTWTQTFFFMKMVDIMLGFVLFSQSLCLSDLKRLLLKVYQKRTLFLRPNYTSVLYVDFYPPRWAQSPRPMCAGPQRIYVFYVDFYPPRWAQPPRPMCAGPQRIYVDLCWFLSSQVSTVPKTHMPFATTDLCRFLPPQVSTVPLTRVHRATTVRRWPPVQTSTHVPRERSPTAQTCSMSPSVNSVQPDTTAQVSYIILCWGSDGMDRSATVNHDLL